MRDLVFAGIYWDDVVPEFVPRREYPGVWPPAEDDCGNPERWPRSPYAERLGTRG